MNSAVKDHATDPSLSDAIAYTTLLRWHLQPVQSFVIDCRRPSKDQA